MTRSYRTICVFTRQSKNCINLTSNLCSGWREKFCPHFSPFYGVFSCLIIYDCSDQNAENHALAAVVGSRTRHAHHTEHYLAFPLSSLATVCMWTKAVRAQCTSEPLWDMKVYFQSDTFLRYASCRPRRLAGRVLSPHTFSCTPHIPHLECLKNWFHLKRLETNSGKGW